MQELKEKMDLMLESQMLTQRELIRLNSKIDRTNEKLDMTNQRIDQANQRIDQTNQRINGLEKKLDENLEKIANMFRGIFENISA